MKQLYLSLAALFCLCTAHSQTVQISKDGKSDYVIVTPDNPAPVVKTAAQELAKYLKGVIVQEFQIFTESERPEGRPAFIIGPAKASAAVFKDPSFSKAQPDEIAIKFKGKDIYLNGQMPRGPLYAVITFLEDYVGICWWTRWEKYIPWKPNLAVAAKDHEYAPKIISRETYYKEAQTPDFAPFLKDNGAHSGIPESYGGRRWIIGFVHTFETFLPPDKYFPAHPEWFSLVKGKREKESQLCLTNDEMRAEFTRIVLEKIRMNRSAGMISVSQNDRDYRCECAKCKAIEEAEGSPSGLILRFVNAVAAEVEKEFPEFLVETLAYQYTQKAPKITRPARNVVIRLCAVGVNGAQPITAPDNAAFRKDFEEWRAISQNLFIWKYITNFMNYLLPYPDWRALAPDIRYFANNNVIGLFEQGNLGCDVGDFMRARQWIIAHLQWNPEQDERKLMEKFFNGYYGAAGPYLLKYIDFQCDEIQKKNFWLHYYDDSSKRWFSYDKLLEAEKIYSAAEDAVKDDATLSKRVRRERIPLDLVKLMYIADIGRARRFLKQNAMQVPENIMQLADEFVELTKNAGNYKEGVPMGAYPEQIRTNVKNALETAEYVPEICKGRPLDSWDAFPAKTYRLHGGPDSCRLVDDPAAAEGKAIRMPGNERDWWIQVPFPLEYYNAEKQWKLVVRVRCDAAANDGIAVKYGIWGKDLFYISETVSVKQCKGSKYAIVETKPFSLKPLLGRNPIFWFAPPDRPLTEVEAVYVDETIFMEVE